MGEKRRWLAAAVVGAGVVVGVGALFRAPSCLPPDPARATRAKAAVRIALPGPGDRLLQEETEMRDLRPLFLPTERNAALADPRREPGRSLLDESGRRQSLTEAELVAARDRLPQVVTINGKPMGEAEPVDALTNQAVGGSLMGFGRGGGEVAAAEARGGFVEVVAMKTGERVLAVTLAVEARPPGDKAWAPVEFLASVGPAGLTSPLMVTGGSQIAEVDLHFKNFLTQIFRVGDRLGSGSYRITVAP